MESKIRLKVTRDGAESLVMLDGQYFFEGRRGVILYDDESGRVRLAVGETVSVEKEGEMSYSIEYKPDVAVRGMLTTELGMMEILSLMHGYEYDARGDGLDARLHFSQEIGGSGRADCKMEIQVRRL
ncbi:MAG: DUF1934 family protein [Firmicutes bacterium]|nr:DUF1934 family protein [Bacillota bacterium]